MNGWEAYLIQTDRLRRFHRLVLYRVRGDRKLDVMCEDGTIQTIDEGVMEPPNAGWAIPSQALAAVAEVFHPYAGHKVEVKRLEEALEVERRRVDRVLGWEHA